MGSFVSEVSSAFNLAYFPIVLKHVDDPFTPQQKHFSQSVHYVHMTRVLHCTVRVA